MRTNWLPLLLVAGLAAACSGQAPAGSDAPGAGEAPAASPPPESGQPPAAGAVAESASPAPRQTLAPAGSSEAVPSATRGTGAGAAATAAPRYLEVTLPAGTELALRLDSALASDASAVEDPVRASLRRDVVIDDRAVLPAGTDLRGAVTSVQRSAKVKGRASIAFRFTSLALDDEIYDIRTSSVARRAEGTKREDAAKIGIGAGAGAIVGGIVGGGKGAAIGTAVGAGTGTGVVLATRGDEVRLAAGTPVTVRLSEPLTVRVPAS